ncbi:alpha/beta hydrolase fold protein [Paracoccidioides lutzii Pb01]|uniref:Alpha/beta hydrolase fold protein n=1 Tax=Paracoccidioides lutzii (strain ATCC MYA-826 / Pb01) TaxID=502779 RepID=C1GPW1_PARBA|nr:alpha/beta hydrolase fold protein [Paracoccidioides lutzii Pb01]EEH36233.1 alpha/beta hydrolase fold protein [Paracoccidioides lutzii Pb01]
MAPTSFPPKLSVLEKLDLVPANLSLIASAIYAAITGLVRGQSGHRYYRKHINHAVIRRAISRFSTRQSQALNPATNQAYENFAKAKGFTPQTVALDHEAEGHWIGNKDAKNVLVYYHGGGFASPANPGFFQFQSNILDKLTAAGKDIAIFFVTYTLTPHAVYPTQLRQAVGALRYIVEKTGRSPENVFIAGDSAGGNLTLGILSHLSHPHKAIEPLELSEPLAGAVPISPWVSFSLNYASVKENQNKDILAISALERWSSYYIAGSESDNYLEPLRAPADWWKDLKVRDMLILTGSDDLFRSPVEEFAEKLKSGFPDTTFFVGKDECHDAPIVALMLGDQTETEQGKAYFSFFSSRL